MGVKQQIARNIFDFAYAIAYRKISETGSSYPKGEGDFHLLKPTLQFWYADPLLATIDGKDILFMEVFDRKKHKGMIGVSVFDENGVLTPPRIILEEPFHLSFPVVFQWKNEWIMMPECADSGELRFYSLNPDTLEVSFIRGIPTAGRFVDTVVLSCDEKITLLTCRENPENPKQTSLVKCLLPDIRQGEIMYLPLPAEYEEFSYLLRNGGPVLQDENGKIRILQESTETEYGHNLIFRRILNEGTTYKEEDLYKVGLESMPMHVPAGYRLQGTHTYSIGSTCEVMDISFNRPHPGNIVYNNSGRE